MKFEKQLYNAVKGLGYDTYWAFKDLNEPKTKFPLIVMSYISDDNMLYLDGSSRAKMGRITFTIFSKKESKLLDVKETLRDFLISGSLTSDFNFHQNTGLTEYHEATKTFGYQLDFDYIYTGDE